MAEEAQPLLPSDEQHHDARPDAPSFTRSASRWQITSPRRIVMLVTLIKFSTVASGMMLLVPLYRLIEDMLCHVHYDDPSGDIIDEMKCKVQEVQSRLAFMLGWFGLLSNIICNFFKSPRASTSRLTILSTRCRLSLRHPLR